MGLLAECRAPLESALERLGPHDHLCSIYETEEDHFAVAAPFIRIGLERNEKCVYITEAGAMGRVREAMAEAGVDVEGSVASGALTFATKDQTYMRYGSFDPEWMFTYWREAAEQAQREGFSSLRATGETEWVVRGGPGLERWMEYESRLTHALAESNAFALCQYNRRLFPPEIIMDVIRTHPIVIYRDTVCRNFYFVPPDEYLGNGGPGREVDRLLNNIRDREQLDEELRRAHWELEQRVRDRTRELRVSERTVVHRNAVLEGINRILNEALSTGTEEELGRTCLDVAESVTRSKFGFIGRINAGGKLDDIAISDPGWSACSMASPTGHRRLPQELGSRGIYGRVLRDGRGLWTNSPANHPDRAGLPEGHPKLTAFLGAPLVHSGKTLGMIGCGNAEGGYTREDLDALESLAAAIVQVLMRKRAEEAARVAEERLRQSQKMESIGVLAGGIAHDFNNLLVGVIGNASLIEDLLPASDRARPFLNRIVESGQQAAYLTRQLLAYAGKGEFVREPVNVSEVVEGSRQLIEGSLPKRIAARFRLEKSLPNIVMDPSQMQQIVMNLVSNAAESIGRESGTIEVSTGIEEVGSADARISFAQWEIQPGACVFLEVRDTGSGMDAAIQARIFDPFFTTKVQGRGLGLAAVAGIVRAMQGAIRLESAPGAGAVFRVLLPVTTGTSTPAAARVEREPDLRGSATVLLVDDEEVVREMAGACLGRQGYTIRLARSGAEAIEIFEREHGRIDLILLDLSMPGMGGDETLPRLREIRPDVPVILSSGYTERDALGRFGKAEIAGYIQKPYTAVALAEAVKRARSR